MCVVTAIDVCRPVRAGLTVLRHVREGARRLTPDTDDISYVRLEQSSKAPEMSKPALNDLAGQKAREVSYDVVREQ